MKYTSYIQRVISLLLGLIIVLVICRAKILGLLYLPAILSPTLILKVLLGSFYDVMYASCLAIIFLGVAFMLKKRNKSLKFLFWIFFGLSMLHVLIGLLNIKIVQMLGVPFNFQWMYYSDMLDNTESMSAVAENFSFVLFAVLLLLCLIMLIVAFFTNLLIVRSANAPKMKKQLISAITLISFCYFIAGLYYVSTTGFGSGKLAHPVVAFVKSAFISPETSSNLFSIVLPDSVEAFPIPDKLRKNTFHFTNPQKVQNILIYVMESVSAEYVAGYSPTLSTTPVLESYLNQSLVFSDIYAHSPSTNNTLVSMLGSIYPMMSYKSISSEFPDLSWPTISSELKKNNYRTGFFHASDNRFKKMDEFLSYRQYDTIMDYRSIPCPKGVLETEWEFLNGVDEECMINAFTNWLSKDSLPEPFFATVWTMQTHYPYFNTGKEKEFVKGNKLYNRYLNALHHSDSLFGVVMQDLQEKGLAESTLVVVVGDHGEAFGQHGQYGHASNIYDENVKVPLIFINPLLFDGQQQEVIGGHIDLAPTLMDVLQLSSPKEWQGTSLFDPQRLNRVYFFSPWSEYLFGYRTPEHKVIYNANENKMMVFDMAQELKEHKNVAEQMPEFVDLSFGRLARWVQYQNSILKEIRGPVTIKGSIKSEE